MYDKPDLRLEIEGMFYRMRVGCPWHDLPKQFGKWSAIYNKFNDWSMTGQWLRIFKAVVQHPDLEWIFIEGSYIKAHQHSAGAAGKHCEAIGISRAGHTSKVHLAVDRFGLPVSFKITAGQVHDASEVQPGLNLYQCLRYSPLTRVMIVKQYANKSLIKGLSPIYQGKKFSHRECYARTPPL